MPKLQLPRQTLKRASRGTGKLAHQDAASLSPVLYCGVLAVLGLCSMVASPLCALCYRMSWLPTQSSFSSVLDLQRTCLVLII